MATRLPLASETDSHAFLSLPVFSAFTAMLDYLPQRFIQGSSNCFLHLVPLIHTTDFIEFSDFPTSP